MRTFCSALLIFNALLLSAQQPTAPNSNSSSKLSIPAQLAHTIRADKVHPGDPVEFQTISAVLVGQGLVMPADAHLYGRVLSVGPKQENKKSYLAVVVERAEWKEHSLPLHAFIAAQITVKPKSLTTANTDVPPDQPSSIRRTARMSGRVAAGNDPSLSRAWSARRRTPRHARSSVGRQVPDAGGRWHLPRQERNHLPALRQVQREASSGGPAHAAKRAGRECRRYQRQACDQRDQRPTVAQTTASSLRPVWPSVLRPLQA